MSADGKFHRFVANDAASTGNTEIYLWNNLSATNRLISANRPMGNRLPRVLPMPRPSV